MQPEFDASANTNTTIEKMFQAMSTLIMQVNHSNQTLMNMLNSRQSKHVQQPHRDPKIRPHPFSGLSTEDVLMWLDHFENVASYHQWTEDWKALELRTVLESIAVTWFIQQPEETKHNWHLLREQLIQHFTNYDITQMALQQLSHLKQQINEPVAQFAIKLK